LSDHLLGVEFKYEAAAKAYCRFNRDVSTQALSDLLTDAEAESISIWIIVFVLVVSNAEEGPEQFVLVFFRNSNAFVCH
jgi:hypothetical protein